MTLTAQERTYSASYLASLEPATREEFIADLAPGQVLALQYDWQFWARDKQLPPPGDWRYWVIIAGRGFGKTRTGAEWAREQVKHYPMVNLIGATADDARDIMIEGESGILAICPPDERPEYKTSKRRLEWPNGARSLIFTADEPERLRGKQHMKLWADELGAWRYAEAWAQAMFGLRLGNNPQACITTTPRPTKMLIELLKHPKALVVTGTTYENKANLADDFYSDIITQYEGTRLGRQELLAELLTDVPGALWQRELLDDLRVRRLVDTTEFVRVGVAIDPAVTAGEDSDETGVIVGALAYDGQAYILADVSGRYSPDGWGRKAVNAYHAYNADFIVGEVNNGGDMVKHVINSVDATVNFKPVRASRGKYTRAEPVAALYEQRRVHHVGMFPLLEDQLCTWLPGDDSPDRLDALVWLLTELMLGNRGPRRAQTKKVL